MKQRVNDYHPGGGATWSVNATRDNATTKQKRLERYNKSSLNKKIEMWPQAQRIRYCLTSLMYESQSGVEYWKKLHNSVAKQISVLLEERRGETYLWDFIRRESRTPTVPMCHKFKFRINLRRMAPH